jgi:error-prone DNA polymerase
MGFYSAATLVKDAQRHGVIVHRPDVGRSDWLATLHAGEVQLGFKSVSGIGEKQGRRCEAERRRAPFASPADFAERCGMSLRQMEVLAEANAFAGFGLSRRQALWEVRAALGSGGPLWAGRARPSGEAPLPEMGDYEQTLADYRSHSLTVGPQLVAFHRKELEGEGVVRAVDVLALPNGRWTRIAGMVIARQHPTTVRGLIFVTLEDETGHANAVIMPEVFASHRAMLLGSPLLVIEGPLQNVDGVATVQARRLRRFGAAPAVPRSHDFH